MKELGYGAGYRYAHDHPGHVAAQQHLPDALSGRRFFEPGGLGAEKRLAERLEWLAARRRSAGAGDEPDGQSGATGV
jgi:putative ATPase